VNESNSGSSGSGTAGGSSNGSGSGSDGMQQDDDETARARPEQFCGACHHLLKWGNDGEARPTRAARGPRCSERRSCGEPNSVHPCCTQWLPWNNALEERLEKMREQWATEGSVQQESVERASKARAPLRGHRTTHSACENGHRGFAHRGAAPLFGETHLVFPWCID
jgi:hypothetical protein